jgi:hypothetical protein
MNVSFKHFFNSCQPEFKSLHGVSWEVKPELYYQYLQTRYLALIAENLGQGQPTTGQAATGSIKSAVPPFASENVEEEKKPAQKQEKEHIET